MSIERDHLRPLDTDTTVNPSWATVFFFQAEDGIRDLTVTGVQTCALPICNGIRGFHPIATQRRSDTAGLPYELVNRSESIPKIRGRRTGDFQLPVGFARFGSARTFRAGARSFRSAFVHRRDTGRHERDPLRREVLVGIRRAIECPVSSR